MGGNGWWPLAFLHHFWSLQLCWLKNPDLPGRCNQRLARPIPAPGSFVASMWFQVPKTRCKRKLRRLWASLTLDVWNCVVFAVCGRATGRKVYDSASLWWIETFLPVAHGIVTEAAHLAWSTSQKGKEARNNQRSCPFLHAVGVSSQVHLSFPAWEHKSWATSSRAAFVDDSKVTTGECTKKAIDMHLWQLHKRAVEFWSVTVLV